MRFIIAILLGALMFQASSLPLPIPRDTDVEARWFFAEENTSFGNTFEHKREKRSTLATASARASEGQTNIRIVRIYHKYRYFLQVSKDGRVGGTHNTNGNVLFRMETYGTSLVRLYNLAAQRYVAINRNGHIISEKRKSGNSLFHEYSLKSGYTRFSLAKHQRDKWLLTLKKNGKVKNAKRTNPGMKATNFLIM